MMIKKFYIAVFLLLTIQMFCQEEKYAISDFDGAYLNEMKIENSELSSRIKTFPQNIQDLNKQVSQAIRDNDDSKALQIAHEMDKLYPNNADIKNFIGKRAAKALDYKTALKYFDEAIKINPKNKWFYINKASVQGEENQLQEALKTIEKLNNLYPNWSIGHNFKAGLLHSLKKDDQALKAYDLAINATPKSAQIFTNRADLLLKLHLESDAISDYKKALQIQPDYSPAKEKLNAVSKTVVSEN